MGLIAIHLILLAVNKVWVSLRGRAVIYSDCLGGARESSKFTAASHSNQVSALGHIEEYFG